MLKLLTAWTLGAWHCAFAQDPFDFIIVGGGTAGLVLASRLSENPSFSVLVLEAGNDHANDIKVKCPGIFATMYGDAEFDWNYQNEPQPYVANRTHANIAGKGLGGGSAVNFMWWTHPSRQDIDNWGALGNANWSWDAIQPYLQRSEAYVAPPSRAATWDLQTQYIDTSVHGLNGSIVNSFPVRYGPFLEAWPRTFQGLGEFPAGDPRGGQALGGSVNLFNIDPLTNERSYTVTGYYRPASRRPNLQVITRALVTKILFESGDPVPPRATGVSYIKNNSTRKAMARKEVILSAGGMQSSKLLELSGIGDCDLLSRFSILCLVDNKNVGENFQNHLMLPLGFEVVPGTITTDDFSTTEAFDAALAEYEATRSGPFSTVNGSSALLSLSQLNISLSSLGSIVHQTNLGIRKSQHDLQILNLRSNRTSAIQDISLVGGISPWYYNDSARVFSSPTSDSGEGNYLTVIGILSHPFSRGSAHIQSADPNVQPRLDPRYLSHPLDRTLSARTALHIQDLVQQPPLSNLLKRARDGRPVFQPGYLSAGVDELTSENVDEFVAARMLIAYHHSGTNAMLPRSGGGVVDNRLRVYGVRGLRVVDISVFPMLAQGTPTSLVVAVAERAADIVKEEHSVLVGKGNTGKADDTAEPV